MLSLETIGNHISVGEENILLICKIAPIQKLEYIFCIVQVEQQIYLLHGAYDCNMFLSFVHEYVPAGTSFTRFANEIETTREFIQAYRKRFLNLVEISEPQELTLIEDICATCADYQDEYHGLDGFSMDAYFPLLERKSHLWCCYFKRENEPLATLANMFLERIGVELGYRFRKCQ